MEGLLLFIALIYICHWVNWRDECEQDDIHDPYLLERGYMLEEDAERLYDRMIRQRR